MKKKNNAMVWLLTLAAALTLTLGGVGVYAAEDGDLPADPPASEAESSTPEEPETPVTPPAQLTLKFADMQATAIDYGQPLSESVISGTAKTVAADGTETVVPGVFAWANPNANIILNAGTSQGQPVVFQPKTKSALYKNAVPPLVPVVVNPKPLTVAVDVKSKVYGETDPALTYTVAGLVGTDTLSGALTRDAGTDVGTYAITQGTLAANSNYTLTVQPGTLAITPRTVNVKVNDQTKVYGAADPELTSTVTGLVNSDTLDVKLTRVEGDSVGRYEITAGVPLAGANYTVSVVPGTFAITPAPLTITADNLTKVYGETDPALTYKITTGALVGGDALTGTLTRAAGESVGTYDITQGTVAVNNPANYTVTFVKGKLTTSPKPLTVTPTAKSKAYGASDPALEYTATGFAYNDTVSSLTGKLDRAAGTNVGSYAITKGTLANPNYTINVAPVNFTITQKQLTLSVTGATKKYDGNTSLSLPHITYKLMDGTVDSGQRLAAVSGYFVKAGELFRTTTVGANITGAVLADSVNYKLTTSVSIAVPTATITAGATISNTTSASEINNWLATGVIASDDTLTIQALANRIYAMSTSERGRLNTTTITKLGDLYKAAFRMIESTKVGYGASFSSSRKIDGCTAWGTGLASGLPMGSSVELSVWQEEPTSSALLQFTTELRGSTITRSAFTLISAKAPVRLQIKLPSSFNTDRDYYVRTSSGERLDVSISRGYAEFTAPAMGTFRFMKDTSSSSKDDDDDDDEVGEFWQDVIDRIYDAGRGEVVRVSVGSRSSMSAEVLREMEGQNVTLSLRRSNGEVITIDGRDVENIPSSRESYTMSALAAQYDSNRSDDDDDDESSSTWQPSSSAPASSSTPASSTPTYTGPGQGYYPPPVTAQPVPPVSSAASSSSEPEEKEEDERPDIAIEAEEDESSSSESSEANKPASGKPMDAKSFGLFALLVVGVAALCAIGIVAGVWIYRRNREE